MRAWSDYQEFQRTKVRRRLSELVQQAGGELWHEMIEQALVESIPELEHETVENDEFHELVTVIFAEYSKNGAVD